MGGIFISYAAPDRDAAKAIAGALGPTAGRSGGTG
jgi:hypothetical protein